jgi:hypothetical protein
MIVTKLESPVYYKKRREALSGKGGSPRGEREKTFEQYLLEAFNGEVVKKGESVSPKLSQLTRENLIRLGNI